MAIVTVAEFKKYADIQTAENDPTLNATVAAAESWVQNYCYREFTVAGTATERTFSSAPGVLLSLPDFVSVDTVAVGGEVVSGDLFEKYGGSVAVTGEARPYTGLRALNGVRRWWSTADAAYPVTVSAAWGWVAIPAAVKMATLMVAKDIASNKNISFGIAGFTDYAGVRAKENPQVAMLLADYRRFETAVMVA